MRVLFLTNSLDIGGIETNLILLAEEMTRRGCSVTAGTSGGQLLPQLEQAGVEHIKLAMDVMSPAALLSDARALRRELRHLDPEVIHSFSATASIVLALAMGLRRIPFRRRRPPAVLASPMGIVTRPGEPRLLTLARGWAVSLGADRVIVTSPAIHGLLKWLPIARARMITMPVQGVRIAADADPADRPLALRDSLGLEPEHKVVTTIGRLDPTKSHELFIDAAARICADRDGVRFLLVGEGSLRGSLERRVAALGLENEILLLGARTDVHALLGITDVCVRPGILEGFAGITVLEAQSLEVPVVAFATEDVKLAIEDGVTGVLVTPGAIHELAAAVAGLLDDPDRCSDIGRAGRSYVERHFAIEQVTGRLLDVYARMLRTQDRGRRLREGRAH